MPLTESSPIDYLFFCNDWARLTHGSFAFFQLLGTLKLWVLRVVFLLSIPPICAVYDAGMAADIDVFRNMTSIFELQVSTILVIQSDIFPASCAAS